MTLVALLFMRLTSAGLISSPHRRRETLPTFRVRKELVRWLNRPITVSDTPYDIRREQLRPSF